MNRRRSRVKGFTLIELLIAVTIVAILVLFALPAYQNSVRKARRTDATAALSRVQLAQEKLRASCRFYGANLDGANSICGPDAASSTVTATSLSPDGRYRIALTNVSATSYTATATGIGDQANDQASGVVCTLVLTVDAANPDGLRTPDVCW